MIAQNRFLRTSLVLGTVVITVGCSDDGKTREKEPSNSSSVRNTSAPDTAGTQRIQSHSTDAGQGNQPDQSTKPDPDDKTSKKNGTTDEVEWLALFDGQSLDDWEYTNFGGEGEVTVEDDSILMDIGVDLTGVHREWPLPRSNYEITLEARRVEGNDFFVGMTFPVKKDYCSLILGGWGGGVCGLSSIDSHDASENETTTYTNFEPGRWYRVRLRVTNSEIAAWLDDEAILAVELEGKKIDVRFEVEQSQPFGLCAYQTKAQIRKLRVRKVSPDASKTEPAKVDDPLDDSQPAKPEPAKPQP